MEKISNALDPVEILEQDRKAIAHKVSIPDELGIKEKIGRNGLMWPRNDHPATPLLDRYSTQGCPADCRLSWNRTAIEATILHGPHKSAKSKVSEKQNSRKNSARFRMQNPIWWHQEKLAKAVEDLTSFLHSTQKQSLLYHAHPCNTSIASHTPQHCRQWQHNGRHCITHFQKCWIFCSTKNITKYFNTSFPLPQNRSWREYTLPTKLVSRVMLCLCGEQSTMGSLLRLPKTAKIPGCLDTLCSQVENGPFPPIYWYTRCHPRQFQFCCKGQARPLWQRPSNQGSNCHYSTVGHHHVHQTGWKTLSLQRSRKSMRPPNQTSNRRTQTRGPTSNTTTSSSSHSPRRMLPTGPIFIITLQPSNRRPHPNCVLLFAAMWRILHTKICKTQRWDSTICNLHNTLHSSRCRFLEKQPTIAKKFTAQRTFISRFRSYDSSWIIW